MNDHEAVSNETVQNVSNETMQATENTATSNHAAPADESSSDVLEMGGADSQDFNQNADETLDLEDKFIDNSVESTTMKMDLLKNSEIKAESASMPHVLVDEELMKEIAAIPDRFGFKIGDVADMLGIKQYVLRYWEQEFDLLKPKKASNNQRLFTRKDVENAFLIRKLLYRDKFSIEGARKALKDVKFAFKKEKDFNSVIQRIDFVQDQIKSFVEDIRKAKEMFN